MFICFFVSPDDARLVYRCWKYPELFKTLPVLMGDKAFSMLGTKDIKDLATLDKVLKDSPEDFGFAPVSTLIILLWSRTIQTNGGNPCSNKGKY